MINNIIHFFRRKYRQIKKLIRYIPIIWKSYDFDYHYALELFKMQLEDIAKHLESEKALTVSAGYNAQRIRTALKLMDKVYNDEYGCEYQDKLKEIYGDNVLKWHFTPTEQKGCSKLVWEYELWDNVEEIKEIENKLFKESQEKQKRAHKLLWELIEANIQKWWD